MNIQEHAHSRWGKSVSIEMTGEDVALAISAYLVSHNIHISGPRTITVNGMLIENGRVSIDPSGFLVCDGERHPRVTKTNQQRTTTCEKS
jgi:hypothetical protein